MNFSRIQSSKSPLFTLSALISQQLNPQSVSDDLWPEVIELALQHGLGPMLLWVVKESDIDTTSDPLWVPLVLSTREVVVYTMALEHAQSRVDAALTKAGIPALWLKGFALARTVYPKTTLRPMVDLDVLVPYEQRESALNVVESLGYHLYTDAGDLLCGNDETKLKISHHYFLKGGVADAVNLELHYQLLKKSLMPLEDLDWFWKQTQSLVQDKTNFLILRPEANMLYLVAHAILGHGEVDFYLLRYFDLHLLITKTDLDWQLVVDQAVALRWTYAVERALTHTVRYFSTPVPESVFSHLQNRRPDNENIYRVIMLQDKGGHWEKMMTTFANLSPAESISLAVRVVFPLSAYMRHRYNIEPERPVWPYYFYRWLNQAKEVLAWGWNRLMRRFREKWVKKKYPRCS